MSKQDKATHHRFMNRLPATQGGLRNFGNSSLQIRQDAFDDDVRRDSQIAAAARQGALTRPGSNKK